MKKFISVRFNEREKFWIKKLNCKVPNGYNIASGGQGNSKIEKFSTNKKIFTMHMQKILIKFALSPLLTNFLNTH